MFTQKQTDLFWKNVDLKSVDECWNWKLSTDRYGYGKVRIAQTVYISHRIAYLLYYGEIPQGKHVLHSCDNPICCNPKHLRAGTRVENVHDMIERGRQAKIKTNPRKMNMEKANALREDFKLGESKHALSRKYGISCIHVRWILRGECWKPTSSD